MKISQLTGVGWCANMLLDQKQSAPFNFDDIYKAADEGRLVELFLKIDDSGIVALWAGDAKARAEMEQAFADAVEVLKGRELRKVGVGDNPLCMVMAIVLEAIQQAVTAGRLER